MEEQYRPFRRIGAGCCGTVWESPEQGSAFKREDGGPSRSLQNDFDMHQRVLHSLRWLTEIKEVKGQPNKIPQIQVPQCYRLIRPNDEGWWAENLMRFPLGYQACNTLHSQRIPPFAEATRRLLVQKYCPLEIRYQISASDSNRDCLIRPYLGRKRFQQAQPTRPSKFKAFSLRNYPLHVDQMEEIGLSPRDMGLYARTMAEALATLHWIGKMDGNDIEFVLAPPNKQQTQPDSNMMSNVFGEHTVWMLDFDLCRDMSMDEEGVKQAVKAYCCNDPFYPRPWNGLLWEGFREQYLQISEEICGSLGLSTLVGLSRLFVDLIEKGN